jgi:peptide/nickel transport system permease protein
MSVGPEGSVIEELESVVDDSAHEPTNKAIEGRTPWQLAWGRLRKDKISIIATVVVLCSIIVAVLSPLLTSLGALKPYETNPELVGGIGSIPTGSFGGISADHWLGVVPGTGWDLLSRLIPAISLSLLIATAATTFAVVVGAVAGIISGYRGKAADFWISRLIDLILAFPQLLMLLALSPVLLDRINAIGVPSGNPSRVTYLIFVLGFFSWPYFARIIRGQVLSLREREFVEAARSLGASNRRIYFKELLPNLWAPTLIYFTLNLPLNISAEAALSFLGVGVQSPTPTLGTLLTDSSSYSTSDPTYFFIPGLTIFIIVLSFNLMGDGLRDALDPKSNR